MKEDGPKQLIWTSKTVSGSSKVSIPLEIPSDQKYFQDVALMAVKIKSKEKPSDKSGDLNTNWKTVSTPSEDAPVAGEMINLADKIDNGTLQWHAPEGEWQILRFG
ncbi:hypothetical protein ADUPG1_003210, partial [Aduncisulcus paluster]